MRYLGTLFLLVAFAGSCPETIQASNDTKTEETQYQTNLSQEKATVLTWAEVLNHTEKSETVSEPAQNNREAALLKWRTRQSHLWDGLPREPFVINASAYTASADECGKSDGITASGVSVLENRTLACPPSYPFGAKISIEGYGVYTCEDRGGAIKGNHFDIYMETKKEAFAFGRKNLLAEVIE